MRRDTSLAVLFPSVDPSRGEETLKRYTILAIAGVLALTLGTATAYFTGETMVQDNVIRAGTVAVSAEPTSSAMSIDSLAPGSTVSKTMDVLNDGSLACSVVVTGAKKMGITDFYEALTCTVTHAGTMLYTGPMPGLRTAPIDLAPGERAGLEFSVGLPAEAGNSLAGDYVKMTLYVDAEQVH